jgi:hypothetical protein
MFKISPVIFTGLAAFSSVTKLRGLSPQANYTDRATAAVGEVVPTFADRGHVNMPRLTDIGRFSSSHLMNILCDMTRIYSFYLREIHDTFGSSKTIKFSL